MESWDTWSHAETISAKGYASISQGQTCLLEGFWVGHKCCILLHFDKDSVIMRQGMSGIPFLDLPLHASNLSMDLQELSCRKTWHCKMEANPNLADCQNSLPSKANKRLKEERNTRGGWYKQAESSEKVVSTLLTSSGNNWWAKPTELAAAHDGCNRKCS